MMLLEKGRAFVGISDIADALTAPFSDLVIRLGVTGLSRAGKTVFITSLVANLMDRGRMPQLLAAANGNILTAYLQPQPDDTIARFAYEDHLARLLYFGAGRRWHSRRSALWLERSPRRLSGFQPRGAGRSGGHDLSQPGR